METKMIPARVIRISAEIAQQAADYIALNSKDTVSLLIVNDICVGIDTAIEIKTVSIRHSKVVNIEPIQEIISQEFTAETIYKIIKADGPISTSQISERFSLTGKSSTKQKLYQIIHSLHKEGYLIRNENFYTTSNKPYTTKKKKRIKMRVVTNSIKSEDVSINSILRILETMTKPITMFEICSLLKINRKNRLRAKVTRLLRTEMAPNGLISVNEKAGGRSTYQLTEEGRQAADDDRVINVAAAGIKV